MLGALREGRDWFEISSRFLRGFLGNGSVKSEKEIEISARVNRTVPEAIPRQSRTIFEYIIESPIAKKIQIFIINYSLPNSTIFSFFIKKVCVCAIFVVTSTCYPIHRMGAPSKVQSHPAGHTVPHFRNLFCKRTAPSISPCMRASLCKHKRPHSRQNIELTLYFCKKRFRKFAYVQFLLYLCTLNCKYDSIAA